MTVETSRILFRWRAMSVLKDCGYVGRCAVANGCFDLIHPGHLELLRHLDQVARQRDLFAIVAMNSDASVRRLKGPSRPIIPEACRADLLNNLRWPFTVVLFDEDTPQELMDFLKPPVVVKGAEYRQEDVVRWSGSEVLSVPMMDGWSTTGIIGDR
jgi:D-beta-D-heptose 7-phosphate kinase/D-beta-D-heptose 1-phosphate adenosyltransferase